MERTEYDWWFVRKDAAIAAMQAIISCEAGLPVRQIVGSSVQYADALIEELKKGE